MSNNIQYVVQIGGEANGRKPLELRGAALKLWNYKGPEVILAGPYETGKLELCKATVYTPTGPRRIGELEPGDLVLTYDGCATVVTGVYPQGIKSIYRFALHDGSSVLVGDEHRWLVGQRKYKRVSASINPKRPKIPGSGYDDWRLMTTEELRGKSLKKFVGSKKETRRKYWLPTAGPARFSKRELLIDPYVMGVLISEGGLTGGSVYFTTGDREVGEEVAKRCPDATVRGPIDNKTYRITHAAPDSYQQRLRYYGLMGHGAATKFIPDDYLYSDIQDRTDLLRGLMDGDGTVEKTGHVSYTSISKRLIDDLRTLVESLGGYVSSVSEKPGSYTLNGQTIQTGTTGYTAHLSLPSGFLPFSLERKNKRVKIDAPPRRFIDSIEYVGEEEAVCISVADPSGLYLTDHFIVTHNTYGALNKIHALAIKYPNCNILMARKQYAALLTSAYQTYIKKVLPYPPGHDYCPVQVFGGGRPEWVLYPNGSRIVIAGLDIPEKVLSAEYDFVFIPQAEELLLHDYEQILSRATGRAGNSPYAQVILDANPGPPNHWIKARERDGALVLFEASHKDNPTLWDAEKEEWTPQGKITMARLHSLTGLRYKRGVLGLWAGSEGQVYEAFDESVHIIDPFPIPDNWQRYRVIDFGYTHPLVCQWWAKDADGRLYMYREIYMTGRTVEEHVKGINGRPGIERFSQGEVYEATICDHDAEDRATLERLGIKTTAAKKDIKTGIELVQGRLKVLKDDRPRLMYFRGATVEIDDVLETMYRPTSTVAEYGSYVWRNLEDQKEVSTRDEVPIDLDNHGLDATRYMVAYLDEGMTKAQSYSYA